MTERAKELATRALIAAAGVVVLADWTLPSYVTLFLDELALFAFVWLMKKIHS